MRGSSDCQLAMLSSLSPEDLIPADHPIRRIRKVVAAVLVELDGEFDAMYATSGRPSLHHEARMARKSFATAAKLSYAGHLLMEHRSALVVDIELSEASGYAERSTALEMLGRLPPSKRRRTVAGDKAYDTKDFVADVRELG